MEGWPRKYIESSYMRGCAHVRWICTSSNNVQLQMFTTCCRYRARCLQPCTIVCVDMHSWGNFYDNCLMCVYFVHLRQFLFVITVRLKKIKTIHSICEYWRMQKNWVSKVKSTIKKKQFLIILIGSEQYFKQNTMHKWKQISATAPFLFPSGWA